MRHRRSQWISSKENQTEECGEIGNQNGPQNAGSWTDGENYYYTDRTSSVSNTSWSSMEGCTSPEDQPCVYAVKMERGTPMLEQTDYTCDVKNIGCDFQHNSSNQSYSSMDTTDYTNVYTASPCSLPERDFICQYPQQPFIRDQYSYCDPSVGMTEYQSYSQDVDGLYHLQYVEQPQHIPLQQLWSFSDKIPPQYRPMMPAFHNVQSVKHLLPNIIRNSSSQYEATCMFDKQNPPIFDRSSYVHMPVKSNNQPVIATTSDFGLTTHLLGNCRTQTEIQTKVPDMCVDMNTQTEIQTMAPDMFVDMNRNYNSYSVNSNLCSSNENNHRVFCLKSSSDKHDIYRHDINPGLLVNGNNEKVKDDNSVFAEQCNQNHASNNGRHIKKGSRYDAFILRNSCLNQSNTFRATERHEKEFKSNRQEQINEDSKRRKSRRKYTDFQRTGIMSNGYTLPKLNVNRDLFTPKGTVQRAVINKVMSGRVKGSRGTKSLGLENTDTKYWEQMSDSISNQDSNGEITNDKPLLSVSCESKCSTTALKMHGLGTLNDKQDVCTVEHTSPYINSDTEKVERETAYSQSVSEPGKLDNLYKVNHKNLNMKELKKSMNKTSLKKKERNTNSSEISPSAMSSVFMSSKSISTLVKRKLREHSDIKKRRLDSNKISKQNGITNLKHGKKVEKSIYKQEITDRTLNERHGTVHKSSSIETQDKSVRTGNVDSKSVEIIKDKSSNEKLEKQKALLNLITRKLETKIQLSVAGMYSLESHTQDVNNNETFLDETDEKSASLHPKLRHKILRLPLSDSDSQLTEYSPANTIPGGSVACTTSGIQVCYIKHNDRADKINQSSPTSLCFKQQRPRPDKIVNVSNDYVIREVNKCLKNNSKKGSFGEITGKSVNGFQGLDRNVTKNKSNNIKQNSTRFSGEAKSSTNNCSPVIPQLFQIHKPYTCPTSTKTLIQEPCNVLEYKLVSHADHQSNVSEKNIKKMGLDGESEDLGYSAGTVEMGIPSLDRHRAETRNANPAKHLAETRNPNTGMYTIETGSPTRVIPGINTGNPNKDRHSMETDDVNCNNSTAVLVGKSDRPLVDNYTADTPDGNRTAVLGGKSDRLLVDNHTVYTHDGNRTAVGGKSDRLLVDNYTADTHDGNRTAVGGKSDRPLVDNHTADTHDGYRTAVGGKSDRLLVDSYTVDTPDGNRTAVGGKSDRLLVDNHTVDTPDGNRTAVGGKSDRLLVDNHTVYTHDDNRTAVGGKSDRLLVDNHTVYTHDDNRTAVGGKSDRLLVDNYTVYTHDDNRTAVGGKSDRLLVDNHTADTHDGQVTSSTHFKPPNKVETNVQVIKQTKEEFVENVCPDSFNKNYNTNSVHFPVLNDGAGNGGKQVDTDCVINNVNIELQTETNNRQNVNEGMDNENDSVTVSVDGKVDLPVMGNYSLALNNGCTPIMPTDTNPPDTCLNNLDNPKHTPWMKTCLPSVDTFIPKLSMLQQPSQTTDLSYKMHLKYMKAKKELDFVNGNQQQLPPIPLFYPEMPEFVVERSAGNDVSKSELSANKGGEICLGPKLNSPTEEDFEEYRHEHFKQYCSTSLHHREDHITLGQTLHRSKSVLDSQYRGPSMVGADRLSGGPLLCSSDSTTQTYSNMINDVSSTNLFDTNGGDEMEKVIEEVVKGEYLCPSNTQDVEEDFSWLSDERFDESTFEDRYDHCRPFGSFSTRIETTDTTVQFEYGRENGQVRSKRCATRFSSRGRYNKRFPANMPKQKYIAEKALHEAAVEFLGNFDTKNKRACRQPKEIKKPVETCEDIYNNNVLLKQGKTVNDKNNVSLKPHKTMTNKKKKFIKTQKEGKCNDKKKAVVDIDNNCTGNTETVNENKISSEKTGTTEVENNKSYASNAEINLEMTELLSDTKMSAPTSDKGVGTQGKFVIMREHFDKDSRMNVLRTDECVDVCYKTPVVKMKHLKTEKNVTAPVDTESKTTDVSLKEKHVKPKLVKRYVRCKVCGEMLDANTNIIYHYRQFHKSWCTKCQKDFGDQRLMKRHQNRNHDVPVFCGLCGLTFVYKHNFIQHCRHPAHLDKLKNSGLSKQVMNGSESPKDVICISSDKSSDESSVYYISSSEEVFTSPKRKEITRGKCAISCQKNNKIGLPRKDEKVLEQKKMSPKPKSKSIKATSSDSKKLLKSQNASLPGIKNVSASTSGTVATADAKEKWKLKKCLQKDKKKYGREMFCEFCKKYYLHLKAHFKTEKHFQNEKMRKQETGRKKKLAAARLLKRQLLINGSAKGQMKAKMSVKHSKKSKSKGMETGI